MTRIWSLGVAFRQGPEFEYDAINRSGFLRETIFGEPRGTVLANQKARFNVPDVIAVGLAFKPSDSIRVTFDYNRIGYSSLAESVISIFEPEEEFTAAERAALEGLSVDDGDVFRLGFEYLLIGLGCPGSKDKSCSVGVRLGAWLDPDHKVRFAAEPGLDVVTRAQAIQFLGGDDELHFTAGVGYVFKRFQIDAAVDLSQAVDTLSLSAIFRLGGPKI